MTNYSEHKAIPSLHEVYKDYFLIGAAVNPTTLNTQQQLIKKHFNSITAENEMKFERLHPKENEYTFEKADEMMAFAKENGIQVRGHTLVWHNQTSDWIFKNEDGSTVNRERLLERMKSHINTVMERYKGQIYSWDVVNEAVSDSGSNIFRDSKWLEIIGEDFLDKAFEYAHEADPNATLFYNDYNESNPEKRDKIYTLTKGLVERGVPIHGVGLQAHWKLQSPTYDNIRQAIEKYASLGLQIQVTEMDVSFFEEGDKRTDLLTPPDDLLAVQAERYQMFFEIFREYKEHITSVTYWGGADDYTWLSNFPVRGRKNWPLVFDENHNPKKSFWNIVEFNK
ncbi:endo-1,4-beta-xylanase [Aquibacillus koreensis]|uniref:Beta-xylanase n=1 Tax=Aquibacillus koreensis TaxID=279446 RepID=A0A9X3WM67_9BACI|nr:endo-1,4-beta-xylanase [Aquibacillus koreensis]MCT2537034.1 endo-1,4-beta-xylanase [Aquibacillus koreensis]MDC3422312.1 endo-1,4-beta-xylanase [Aquibacillus koreensis]